MKPTAFAFVSLLFALVIVTLIVGADDVTVEDEMKNDGANQVTNEKASDGGGGGGWGGGGHGGHSGGGGWRGEGGCRFGCSDGGVHGGHCEHDCPSAQEALANRYNAAKPCRFGCCQEERGYCVHCCPTANKYKADINPCRFGCCHVQSGHCARCCPVLKYKAATP